MGITAEALNMIRKAVAAGDEEAARIARSLLVGAETSEIPAINGLAADGSLVLDGLKLPAPYTRDGAAISERLAEMPTAKGVLDGVADIPGSGFTGITTHGRSLLPNHTSTGLLADEVQPPQQITMSDLLGRDLLAIVGDNTGRHTVTGVNGVAFDNPVKSMAGFQYIDVPGQGYAGAKSPTSAKYKEALRSQDPYYVSVLMGDQSGDFARHTGNVYGEMARKAEIATKDIPKVDAALRDIPAEVIEMVTLPNGETKKASKTIRPFKDFPSVADPNAVADYINNLPTGTLRAQFLKGLDKAGLMRLGMPSVGDARLAVADERQLGMDWGTAGYRGFTPDLERGPHPTTLDQSTTYDTGIDKVGPSQSLIGDGMGIPANLLFRDTAQVLREKGTGGGLKMTSPNYKVFEGSPARAKQRVDDQLVEMVDTFLEMERRFGRESAIRYAGDLLRGGKITAQMITEARKANAPNWVIAAMMPAASAGGLLSTTPSDAQAATTPKKDRR